jgi:hypothetical protein
MNIILNCTYNIQITDLGLERSKLCNKNYFINKLREENKLNFYAKILDVQYSELGKFKIVIENVFKDTILKDCDNKLYLHPGEYIVNLSTLDKCVLLIQNELN